MVSSRITHLFLTLELYKKACEIYLIFCKDFTKIIEDRGSSEWGAEEKNDY